MKLRIEKMSDCTLRQALQAWNDGFIGYYFNATMSLDAYTHRLGAEGLSPDLSVIAFDGDQPIGCILSGVRDQGGRKVSWNGGTGVAPDYRRHGVGRRMLEASLSLYKEAGVELATLEAIAENEKAIALYASMGYETVDRVVFVETTEEFTPSTLLAEYRPTTEFRVMAPADCSTLPFYDSTATWQTQWQSLKDGRALWLVEEEQALAYAMYRIVRDPQQKPTTIVLYQCRVTPDLSDAEQERVLRRLMTKVYQPGLPVKRSTMNLPLSNEKVYRILHEAGFTKSIEQVYMLRNI